MTVRQCISKAAQTIPPSEAWVLLEYVTNCDKLSLITNGHMLVTNEQYDAFMRCVHRREQGCPIAYVIGKKEFYSLPFYVTENCLIPRPETELLVDIAVSEKPKTALDLCTGTGCIAISLAINCPNCMVTAVDISEPACEIARKNSQMHSAENRINIKNANALTYFVETKYNIITVNPPYVKTEDISQLDTTVKDYEPHLALDGGEDGLEFYRQLIPRLMNMLTQNGMLIMEIGCEQAEAVTELAKPHTVRIVKDGAGLDRVICIGG